jgi:hypothetical protein
MYHLLPCSLYPIPLTLAITWPQGVISEEDSLAVAAQVHGGVS